MKILSITPLGIPELKVLRIARFPDDRGYFSETLRVDDLANLIEIPYFQKATWHQINESYSRSNVMRGLHFQWDPHMGKYVRAIEGSLIDLMLDIRIGSPSFGNLIAYKLEYRSQDNTQEILWIPPGFAHGFVAITSCRMEYVCTGWWAPKTERAITIYDEHIDWSLIDSALMSEIQSILPQAIVAEKDRNGMRLVDWKTSPESNLFMNTLPVS